MATKSYIEALEAENATLRARIVELEKLDVRVTDREELQARVTELEAQLAVALETIGRLERDALQMLKKVTGRTSEKSSTSSRHRATPRPNNDLEAQRERSRNRSAREAKAPVEDVQHPLSESDAECELCGSPNLATMQPDPPTNEFEYRPGKIVRLRHHRHKAICTDCRHIVRAPAPTRVVDGSTYGPGLVAETVVRKVVDCLPLYRQAKIWAREGCPIPRSTLKDLFHRGADLLAPLYSELAAQVVESEVVFADETSLKMQVGSKTGFIWTFATEQAVIYRYAATRSGQVPVDVLGDTSGLIVVDGYSGYNHICTPERRTRAGCNAHARRKFVDIDDDGARRVLELYKEVWAVEREAKADKIVGTEAHLELRRARAAPAMAAIKKWCDDNRSRYGPKEPVGKAITYVTNQWECLTRFLEDVRIPPDNILSERLLRNVALGRKNYLFVGHEDAGQNLAMLASLVVTCEFHDVHPQQYLADVLIRVQSHPAGDVRSLLPDRWKLRYGTRETPTPIA